MLSYMAKGDIYIRCRRILSEIYLSESYFPWKNDTHKDGCYREADCKEVEGLLVKEVIKMGKVAVYLVVDLCVDAKVIACQVSDHCELSKEALGEWQKVAKNNEKAKKKWLNSYKNQGDL